MVADLGSVGASLGSMRQQSLQNSLAENSMLSAQSTKSAIGSMTAAVDGYKSSERNSDRGTSVGRNSSSGWSSQVGSNFDSSVSAMTDSGKTLNLTDGQKFALTWAAGNDASTKGPAGQAGKGPGGKATAGFAAFSAVMRAGGSGMTESQLQMAYQSVAKGSETKAFKDGLTAMTNAGGGTSADDKSSAGSRRAEGVRASVQEAQQFQATAQQAAQRSEAAQTLLSTTATGSAGTQANMANAVQAALGGPGGIRALQNMSVPEQMQAVQSIMDKIVASQVGQQAMGHGGASGVPEDRAAAVRQSAGDRTSGAAGTDLTNPGGPPKPPASNGPGAAPVQKWGKGQKAQVAGPDGAPSLPSKGNLPAVTPESVTYGANDARTMAQAGIVVGKGATQAQADATGKKVGQEQGGATLPGKLTGRAADIAADTVMGTLNGKGGTPYSDGGRTVTSGAFPDVPPQSSGAGAAQIPTDPITPPPDTPRRKSGRVEGSSAPPPPPPKPPVSPD